MLFFLRGQQNKYIASTIYRICDISHLRYLKAEKKIKQRPRAHFHSVGTAKQRRSEKTEERKTTGAIWVLPFRGGAEVNGSNGTYLC